MPYSDAKVLPVRRVAEHLLTLLGKLSPFLQEQLLLIGLPTASIWASLAYSSCRVYEVPPLLALDVATAIFAIQVGTGLLDEVQDNELSSVGSLTAHHRTNLGLALVTCAFSLLPRGISDALPLLTNTVVSMCAGQNLDLCDDASIPTLEMYEARVRLKVGVFGALTLRLPALIGHQPAMVLDTLSVAGEQLALFYQVRNDREGAFGDRPSTDLTQRWTWPSVFALSVVSEGQRDFYLTTRSAGQTSTLRNLLIDWTALQYLAALEIHYAEQFLDTFNTLNRWEFQAIIRDYCMRYFHIPSIEGQ